MNARGFSIATFVALHIPATAHACAVCMGADDKTGGAINGAIFLLLGCIGGVLASLAGFAFYLIKRASVPMPPADATA